MELEDHANGSSLPSMSKINPRSLGTGAALILSHRKAIRGDRTAILVVKVKLALMKDRKEVCEFYNTQVSRQLGEQISRRII